MQLTFYGAAGEVTGSCHLLQVNGHRLLLDCGLIQGSAEDEARNARDFPFAANEIDAVLLSHAHLDHSGRLPLLMRRGFNGPVHTHNATRELCAVLLRDAAHLQELEIRRENRHRAGQRRPPVQPLYGIQDAEHLMRQIVGHRYGEAVEVVPGVTATFVDAGHILGSACLILDLREGDLRRRLVFSGDLGQYDTPILHDPTVIDQADLVLMECTYGGQTHRQRAQTIDELGEIITRAAKQHGNILIPAFAIGRSQELLYELGKHYDDWSLSHWQVFLDSPMAIEASEIYWDYTHLYDEEASRLRPRFNEMPRLRNLHLTRTAEESKVINRLRSGAIIIAGSGMCTGGRILHHLKQNISTPATQIVIVGYQAEGTLGRALVDGAPQVLIHGDTYAVRARVHTVGGLSAHADEPGLCRWYENLRNRPPVQLVHGEPHRRDALARTLRTRYGIDVGRPAPGDSLDLARSR